MQAALCPSCGCLRLLVTPTRVSAPGVPVNPPQVGEPRVRRHLAGKTVCPGSGARVPPAVTL